MVRYFECTRCHRFGHGQHICRWLHEVQPRRLARLERLYHQNAKWKKSRSTNAVDESNKPGKGRGKRKKGDKSGKTGDKGAKSGKPNVGSNEGTKRQINTIVSGDSISDEKENDSLGIQQDIVLSQNASDSEIFMNRQTITNRHINHLKELDQQRRENKEFVTKSGQKQSKSSSKKVQTPPTPKSSNMSQKSQTPKGKTGKRRGPTYKKDGIPQKGPKPKRNPGNKDS